MDLGLSNRVALVTASSKGLGRASAIALAKEGASVVIAARGREALLETESMIRDLGAEVVAIECDVSEKAAAKFLVNATIDHFGQIDVLVANNGGPPQAGSLDFDDDALYQALEANLISSIRLVRESLVHMRPAGFGRICCIASFSIVQPIPTLALSNTARTALWAWAKTAARELMGSGVTLNLACPGFHLTDRVRALGPIGRVIGDPEDFGKIVAFLCSQPAGYINGAAIVVDGGETLAL